MKLSNLVLSAGVGQATVTLPEGEYTASVEGGVGQTIITLPRSGDFRLEVDGGVGEIVIQVPRGLAVQVNVDRGISALELPKSYQQQGDVYTSPGYETAEKRIRLFINQGIGNIAIRER